MTEYVVFRLKDTEGIRQAHRERLRSPMSFAREDMERHEILVPQEAYTIQYRGELDEEFPLGNDKQIQNFLEGIARIRLNSNGRLKGFEEIFVSDVIGIVVSSHSVKYFFCDSIGFKEVRMAAWKDVDRVHESTAIAFSTLFQIRDHEKSPYSSYVKEVLGKNTDLGNFFSRLHSDVPFSWSLAVLVFARSILPHLTKAIYLAMKRDGLDEKKQKYALQKLGIPRSYWIEFLEHSAETQKKITVTEEEGKFDV